MTEFGAAASSSSSSVSKWPYHVFLSFRGEDTRYGFTGNLYHALCGRGIRTFIDDEGIRKGEEITPTLLKKIKESKTAIVVFSKDYASSTFCLTELAQIIDCMKDPDDRFIWPVFYDVDPSDIRHQKGSYKEAFDQYEGVKDETMVKRWRLALTEAANMSGWPFDPRSELYQYKIIDEIVQEVSKVTRIGFLHVARFLVGLQPRAEAVCSLLNKEPHCDGATIVGIFGVGGIGKSTIARATYNEIAINFKHKCFLNDIKDRSICEVQGRLLSEILSEKDINLKDYNFGISVIRDKLCDKKVLLVLDDISTQEQLGALAGESNWFGDGSKIIITTRDKSLLQNHGIYEVPELNDREARQLLILNAFKKEEEDPEYKEVINRAVKYGFGLPLALETFGSTFGHHRTVKEMESFLDIQEKFPNKTVQQSLKVSYDCLEELYKEIFLDIACFYRGCSLRYATEILSARHGIDSEYCINILIDKSLVKLGERGHFNIRDLRDPIHDKRGYLYMHDLIQEMGQEIVKQESPDVGQRSRLWSEEDILHVLNENTGTGKVQGMVNSFDYGKVEWRGKAFEKMKNLRVLSFSGGLEFSQGPKCLPNCLRVMEWYNYPSSALPDDFCPINLVVLRLTNNHLKTLGKAFKNFNNLRQLNLSFSKDLQKLPNMSEVVNLEVLEVSYCNKLTKIDDSVGRLVKLKVLNAERCISLDTFIVKGMELVSLEVLNLSYCFKLHTFPKILVPMKKIKTFDMSHTAIRILPESIGKLDALERLSNCNDFDQPDLKTLYLFGCIQLQEIRKIPPNIKVFSVKNFQSLTTISIRALLKLNLYNLREIDVSCSENLEEFPDISEAVHLEVLDVSYCEKLTKIDDSVGHLAKLKVLNAKGCGSLDTFIVKGLELVSLEILNLSNCSNLHTFPEILVTMEKIKTVDLSHTALKILPESIEKLVAVERLLLDNYREIGFKTLYLSGCEQLQEIRKLPPNIEVFSGNCKLLTSSSMKAILKQKFYNLRILDLRGNESLEEIPDISGAMNLEELSINCCHNLTKIDDSVGYLTKLRVLEVDRCLRLDTFIIGGIKLVSLEILNVWRCYKLHTFSNILVTMEKIRTLDLRYTAIKTLPKSIEKLVGLKKLCLSGLTELRQLPNLACRNLRTLYLKMCKNLEEIKGISPNIEVFSAWNCTSLTSCTTRLLLGQKWHDTRNRQFVLPGEEIPKWFHRRSTRGSVSFWVRKKLPRIALCAVLTDGPTIVSSFMMIINGTYKYGLRCDVLSQRETDHIFLFDLREQGRDFEIERDILTKEWNRVEVSWEGIGTESRLKCIGVYVYNYDSSRKDVLFENPIHHKRIPGEVGHQIFYLNLEPSSVYCDNNRDHSDSSEEDLQQQQHLSCINQQILGSSENVQKGGNMFEVTWDAIEIHGESTIIDEGHDGRGSPYSKDDKEVMDSFTKAGPSINKKKRKLNVDNVNLTLSLALFERSSDITSHHEIMDSSPKAASSIEKKKRKLKMDDENLTFSLALPELSSDTTNHHDLQQQQHLSSIDQNILESSGIVKQAKGKDIIVYGGDANEKKGRNALKVTCQNCLLSSNNEILTWDPMKWEYELTRQKDQSTVMDKGHDVWDPMEWEYQLTRPKD